MSDRKRALLLSGLLLVCAAFPLRIRYGIGIFRSVSILDLFLVLTPLWLLLANWERPHLLDLGERTITAILALPLVLAVASLAWSENSAQTLYSIVQTLLALAAYLLIVNLLRSLSPAAIMNCLALFLLVAVITAGLGLAHVPGFGPGHLGLDPERPEHLDALVSFYTRLSHPFWGLSNAFAGVLAFFVPVLIGWGAYTAQRRFHFLAGVVFVAIALSLSRGTVLAVLIGLVACLVFWPQRRRLIAGLSLGLCGSAGLGLWVLASQSPLLMQHIVYRLTGTTVEARLEKFTLAAQMIKEAPLLGYGAGVIPQGQVLLTGGVHNTFLQMAMELGVPLSLLLATSFFLLSLLLLRRKGPFARTNPLMTVAIGAGLLVELIVFMTQAQFEGAILRILFYQGMGFASALLRIVPNEPDAGLAPGRP